jgi:AAT family amino acid transporter
VGLHNLTGLPGGFVPHGFGGVWMAVILGILSFNGIEVIAVTSGEARDPVRAIPAALRTMALRLFLFYILALAIVVSLVPWTETGAAVVTQSPFVRIFAHSGIRHAAGIMNFVVLTAALSSMNTNVYLCSRMLFSLSRGGYAPRLLGRLSRTGTPTAAILLSGGCILSAAYFIVRARAAKKAGGGINIARLGPPFQDPDPAGRIARQGGRVAHRVEVGPLTIVPQAATP